MRYIQPLAVSFLTLTSTLVATLETEASLQLPEVAQNTDVHELAITYCRQLWKVVDASATIGYVNSEPETFKTLLKECATRFQRVLDQIKEGNPINELGEVYHLEGLPALQTALDAMKVFGKHKGSVDYDNETEGRVNEIFVYCWRQVDRNLSKLMSFLFGLQEASPTCIQGYSVRMLCAIHPPRLKRDR